MSGRQNAIINAAKAGQTKDVIAALYSVSPCHVHAVCRRAGVEGRLTKAIHQHLTRDNLRSFVVITPSGCWEWPGRRDRKLGYAQVGSKKGHRLAYELFNGPIPPGLHVCHKCDNPPCMNPEHLFAGTAKDNMQDKVKKGRGRRRGFSTKLTEDDVRQIRVMRFGGGFTLKQIGERFGVSHEAVRLICGGKTWGHVAA